VQDEASEGNRRQILVPAKIDDVETPLGFRSMQSARLIDWDGKSPHSEFDMLLKAVRAILGVQAVNMDSGGLREQLKAAEAAKERLRKKIAVIGGPVSTALSLKLDKIEEEMSKAEVHLEKGHGSHGDSQKAASDTAGGLALRPEDIIELTSRIGGIEAKLEEMEKRVEGAHKEPSLMTEDGRTLLSDGKRRRKLARWVLLVIGLLLLVFGARYILGLVLSQKQLRTMEANGVQVTLVCPRIITEGKPIHIQCLIDRVKGSVPEIIVGVKRPKSGCFIMMNKQPWVRAYRFEKSPSMDDSFDLRYSNRSSILGKVFHLFSYEAIQAEITDSKNKKLCSVRFAVQVNSISAIIASVTAGVIGLLLAGLSVAGKTLMEGVIKKGFNV
jgi:hypothetical protein